MKGLLKLSTVALSAAMVAGMSTPVFAAGASVGGTDSGTKINVTDVNGYVVATTKSDVKTYNFKGIGTGEDTLAAKEAVEVNLAKGGVKKLTATASDGSAVKWTYDNDTNANLKAAKESVTIDNGTITVAKDATVSSVTLLAYTDSSVNKDSKEGKLKDDSYVTVTVNVFDPTSFKIEYVNADTVFTATDLNTVDLKGHLNATDKTEIKDPGHTSAELKNDPAKTVNHVTLGNSATFNITTGDDSDYNTAVEYTTSNEKFLDAETTDGALTGTVSVVGTTPNEYGIGTVTAKLGGHSSTLYVVADGSKQENVYRVYNPNSGEHFYTTSPKEVKGLEKLGWQLESIGWVAPTTGDEVYRLYNHNTGEHHYTVSAKERDALKAAGWSYEGVAFHSASKNYSPIYREYNKNEKAFNHNYTSVLSENNMLVAVGWKYEGVAFYAVAGADESMTAAQLATAAQNAVKASK